MKKLNARVLGARIKAARSASGMTQSRLAERAGIEVQSLSRIERGAYEPSLSTTVALARALGQSLDALVLGTSDRGSIPRELSLPEARDGLLEALQQFERSVSALELAESGSPRRVQHLRHKVTQHLNPKPR